MSLWDTPPPKLVWSDYPLAALHRHAALVRALHAGGREVWTIFDNTAAGHAPANALTLSGLYDGM